MHNKCINILNYCIFMHKTEVFSLDKKKERTKERRIKPLSSIKVIFFLKKERNTVYI